MHRVPSGDDALSLRERRSLKAEAKRGAAADRKAQAKADDEATSVKKRPAVQETPRKRPAAELSRQQRSGEQGAGSSAQESEDSHSGSYDEPPKSQPQSQLGKPAAKVDVLSRLGPSGSAPFRGLL